MYSLYRHVGGAWTLVVRKGDWWKNEETEETVPIPRHATLPDDSWKGCDVPCCNDGHLYHPYDKPRPPRGSDHPHANGIHFGYRVEELERAFDLIKDKKNWKNPIKARIPVSEIGVCNVAAAFYTGAGLAGNNRRGGFVTVTGNGYYLTVGS